MDERTKIGIDSILYNMQVEVNTIQNTTQRQTAQLHRKIMHLRRVINSNTFSAAGEPSRMQDGIRHLQPTASGTCSDGLPQNAGDDISQETALLGSLKRGWSGNNSDEPEARRPCTNSTDSSTPEESSERSPQRDFLPPSLRTIVERTRGILEPAEFLSFLFITLEVESPVLMTMMAFTKDIYLVYYQLLALKYNIGREYTTDQDAPLEVREFLHKLEEMITAFNREIKQVHSSST